MGDLGPDAWISLIVARADELRAKGVTTLTIDGVSFTLAAAEPVPDKPTRSDDDEPLDVFNDPATYGRTSGVPGFTRPKDGDM